MRGAWTRATGRIAAAAAVTGRHRLALQVVAGAAAFGLGFWGWLLKNPPADANGWFDALFRTIQLITLHFPDEFDGTLPWQLQVGRLAVPLVTFVASFDVVLGAITRPVRLAALPLARDHLVFFGQPRLADVTIRRLVARGHRPIFVQPALQGPRLDVLEGIGVTVVDADPFRPGLLDDLGLASACAVFIATGNDVDGANLAVLCAEAMAKRPAGARPPVLAVEFDREDLAAELAAVVDASARNHALRFHRLSPDRESLSIELARHVAAIAPPCDGPRPHALVIGLVGGWEQVLSRLIVALQIRPDETPLLTLVLDEGERQRFAGWRRGRPDLPLVVAVEILPRGDGGFGEADAREVWCARTPPPHLVVVMREDADGLATALALRRHPDRLRTATAPVLVRQSREDRILPRLASDGDGPVAGERAPISFGAMLREETILRLIDPASEKLPIALHARYLAAAGTLGVGSQAALAAWEALPETLRDAGRAAADHLPFLPAALGRPLPTDLSTLERDDWDRLARTEHRRWCADRIDHGWCHGTVRDDAARRHPCLVPWEALSEADRQKDRNSVHTLLTLGIGTARPTRA